MEFKESYNWNNRYKYAKALSTFDNNQECKIVLGVNDSPREAIVLNNDKLENTD